MFSLTLLACVSAEKLKLRPGGLGCQHSCAGALLAGRAPGSGPLAQLAANIRRATGRAVTARCFTTALLMVAARNCCSRVHGGRNTAHHPLRAAKQLSGSKQHRARCSPCLVAAPHQKQAPSRPTHRAPSPRGVAPAPWPRLPCPLPPLRCPPAPADATGAAAGTVPGASSARGDKAALCGAGWAFPSRMPTPRTQTLPPHPGERGPPVFALRGQGGRQEQGSPRRAQRGSVPPSLLLLQEVTAPQQISQALYSLSSHQGKKKKNNGQGS